MANLGFATTLAIFLAMVSTATFVTYTEGAARAFFVFGDSLVDNGNNNYLATSARADSPPYGVDYPTHRPTGRFSNGLNIPDLISQQLGAEPTLPYLDPALTGDKLLVGANFASAGIGILNDTGIQFANIIRMPRQLELFQEYQQRVSALIGAEQTQRLVNNALILITLGGNDYVNNYFLTPVSARRIQYNIQDYSRYLVTEYRKILKKLDDLGARRVLVTGTGPLGCVPAELAMRSSNGDCAKEPQQAAAAFNPLLVQMIKRLNQELGSDIFVAVNAMEMQNDFINNPKAFGFVTSKIACCGQGPFNGIGLCTAASNLCPNREEYAFWDPFHPSEKANKIIVKTIYSGSDKYITPMNLSTIMAIDSV
ncbi:GDSL esterase/lipase At4g28780 [Nicotiana tabacum]|uniref:GDSL esterase/lipase At4g28780 n=2 Tax=Nicotiana tabacum TaxID=4097 RepID=A0A1S3ZAV8_TOBAC|nr:PREDICTED: GDSL esterase/lipase At4g28780-like [Nicotiana tabacum]